MSNVADNLQMHPKNYQNKRKYYNSRGSERGLAFLIRLGVCSVDSVEALYCPEIVYISHLLGGLFGDYLDNLC